MERRNKYALGLILGVILFMSGLQTPLFKSTRGQMWEWWVKSVGGWFRVGELAVSNDAAEQMAVLTIENIRLRAEINDYARLKQQMGSMSFDDYKLVAAEIAADPTDPLKTSYLLNRGASDGVRLGSPVVVYNSAVVGMIAELFENSSRLDLTTNPQTSFPAEVVNDENPGQGLVKGRTYTTVELSMVRKDANLALDQPVVTSGQGALVPAGLLVGTIDKIISEEYDSYQQALLKLPYDPRELKVVQILSPP